MKNGEYGIEIRDPSRPTLMSNKVSEHSYQVKLEGDGGRRWREITDDNPGITGDCDVPQGIMSCSIF